MTLLKSRVVRGLGFSSAMLYVLLSNVCV
jgi:hypothetical protein